MYELAVLSGYVQLTSLVQAGNTLTRPNGITEMVYVRDVMSLVQASQSVLDVLLRLNVSAYRRCPTVTTVRALYAVRVVYCLWKRQDTRPSSLVTEEVLALRFYAKQTEGFFERAREAGHGVADMALGVLSTITNVLTPNSESSRQIHSVAESAHHAVSEIILKQPSNDLEAILTISVTPKETTLESPSCCSNAEYVDPCPTEDERPFCTLDQTDCYPHGEGHVLASSEFGNMMMPDLHGEGNWGFSDELLGFSIE